MKSINSNKFNKIFFSLCLDIFLWGYFFIILYKIFYEKLILSLRYPEFQWVTIFYLIFIGAMVAIILYFFRSLSIGRAVLKNYDTNKTINNSFVTIFSIILILITFIAGLFITRVSITEFFSASGLAGAKRIFLSLLKPDFSIFQPAIFSAIETVYMAFIATTFAIPIAFIISFLAARNLMTTSKTTFIVYNIARFIMNITRSIEPLVWAIIFSVWVGIGPFAGMLALCLHSIASLTKLYSEQIENIDNGPVEAITSLGAHPIQIIWFGVVPQILLPFLSYTIYRWDINVRMATIIGLVGGGGIGTMIMQYQGLARWNEVGLLIIIIASIVWLMDYISAKIREALK